MKLLYVALALISAVCANLPACAQTCVNQATSGDSIGSCPSKDGACICKNQALLNQFACCLSSGCSKSDQQASVDYAKGICNGHGVTVPSSVVC